MLVIHQAKKLFAKPVLSKMVCLVRVTTCLRCAEWHPWTFLELRPLSPQFPQWVVWVGSADPRAREGMKEGTG